MGQGVGQLGSRPVWPLPQLGSLCPLRLTTWHQHPEPRFCWHQGPEPCTVFFFSVTKSKCPSYVGVTGILLQETKHVFKIITKEDHLKGRDAV